VSANFPGLQPNASSLERKFWGFWTLNYPQHPLISEFDDISSWELDYAYRRSLSKRAKRFRLDFAHEETRVGIEIQGGIYTRGRHVTGAGYERDAFKYNLAYAGGWVIFLMTPEMIRNPRWYALIAATIESRVGQPLPAITALPQEYLNHAPLGFALA